MAITPWTDEPATSKTPKLALHVTELRTAVEAARTAYSPPSGGWTPWTNVPLTTNTPALAAHVSEMRTAIQQLWNEKSLGTIPAWSKRGGAAPTASTPAYAADVNDVRLWFNLFESDGQDPPVVYWGVDSAERVTTVAIDGTMLWYNWVVQEAQQVPVFWGRYIGGNFSLTSDEIAFLHHPSRQCKILLVYNGTNQQPLNTFAQGLAHANAAIDAAQTLGAPPGVLIWVDIEEAQTPSSEFLQGWSQRMFTSTYAAAGGIYAATRSANFNPPNCDAHSAMPQVMEWSYIFSAGTDKSCGLAVDQPPFAPTYPPTCNAKNVIVWQYGFECYQDPYVTFNRTADECLATPIGFSLMW